MKKILIIISVIICVFCAFWLYAVPKSFVLLKPWVYEQIEKNFGYEFSDEGFVFATKIVPTVVIKAEKFTVKNPSGTEILSAKSPVAKVDLIPLLWGQIRVCGLDVDDFSGILSLDEQFLHQESVLSFLKKLSFNASSVNVKKYDLVISQTHKAEGVKLVGKEFLYSKNLKNRVLKLDAKTFLESNESNILVELDIPRLGDYKSSNNLIEIKNLNLSDLNKFFSKYLPSALESVSGVVDIVLKGDNLSANLKELKVQYKENFKNIEVPSRTKITSLLNLSEKELSLSKLNLTGDGVTLKGSLILEKLGSKNFVADANIEFVNTLSASLINLLPAIHTPDLNLFYLKKYPLYGVVNGNLSIRGKSKTPLIYGDIFVNNAYLVKPIVNDLKRATIKVGFSGDKVSYDVLVGVGGLEQVEVKGGSELYGSKKSRMTIKSSENVQLATAKTVVDMLRKILYFDVGPVPIMKLDGFGNIDITVEGNRSEPHVWGKMNFKNTNASFVDVKGLVFQDAKGYINFENQNVDFKIPNALIDGNKVLISGTCNLFGDLKVFVETNNLSLFKIHKIINESPMLKDIKTLMPPVDKISGLADVKLDITGKVPNIEEIVFKKNIFAKGVVKFRNAAVGVNDFTVSDINGKIDFENTDVTIDAVSNTGDSSIFVNGYVKNDVADIKINSDSLDLKDLLAHSAFKGLADGNVVKFNCKYTGRAGSIDFQKVILDLSILKSAQQAPVILSGGNVSIKNGSCLINNIKGLITENPFVMNAKIINLGQKNQNINANISLNNAALSTVNVIREFYLIPWETKQLLRRFEFEKGVTDIDLKVVNNKPYMDFVFDEVLVKYLPLELPLKIINGQISLKNDLVQLTKINTLADDMPIFIDGKIQNIYKNPYAEVYLNSVPKQTFIDKYINKNSLYPLKIKGDIIYSTRIKGVADLYNITANAKIGERSSVYYMGASLGDTENPTIIDFDGDIVKNNSIKINNFEYNKSVLSQNNKQNIINFLKVKGLVRLVNSEPYFKDLIVKTENATDARIFNVIFKKPHIKQGLFNSDLRINGKLSDMKLIGTFNIYDIDVPLMQTILKSVSLIFEPSIIKIDSRAELFSNEIKLNAIADNRLVAPLRIKSGIVHFDKLDLNSAISEIKKFEINKPKQNSDKQDINLTILEIGKLDLTADNVLIKGLAANNLKTMISLSDKMLLSLNDFTFDLANGKINGDFDYNLLSNRADLLMNVENIDANELLIMLFDLSNQMYGALTGTVKLSCNGSNSKTCMSTLSGKTVFNVSDGRMPKLGSLEYLLKAGNLLKGGFTGLSINGLIDLITPLKTGEFSNIFGKIKISQGIADDIQISTKGKDLSLYMKGNYNIVTSDAKMYVFGLLSKHIKTPLGAIGNVSLNTLFNLIPGVDLESESTFVNDINKIPGIELSQKAFRKFIAEIVGDINGENYVKSFRWVN